LPINQFPDRRPFVRFLPKSGSTYSNFVILPPFFSFSEFRFYSVPSVYKKTVPVRDGRNNSTRHPVFPSRGVGIQSSEISNYNWKFPLLGWALENDRFPFSTRPG
jgi:hypothetical protein